MRAPANATNPRPKTANTEYPIIELLSNRWSPRQFSDEPISETDFKILMESVRWAASSNNYQPWRFIYANQGEDAYGKIISVLSEFNQQWAVNAPLLVLAGYKKHFDNGKENFHALHDLGLALGNMSAQAQSMNIALHHMAGVDWKKAHEVFEVPGEEYHIATAVAIGYYGGDVSDLPDDLAETERKERSRKKQSEFVFCGSWK